MPIDPSKEKLLTLAEASLKVPGPNKPNPRSVYRWARSGVRGVKLETYLISNVRYTTVNAIRRFLDEINKASVL